MNHRVLELRHSEPKAASRRPVVFAAILWGLFTLLSLAILLGIYLARGQQGLLQLIQSGPYSDTHLTLFSVAISWLLVGTFLLLLACRRVNSGNVLTLGCFFCVCLLYVNIFRERTIYGDTQDYIRAAYELFSGISPLHARYIYPPFWATVLEPLVALGLRTVFDFIWLLNLFSLGAFYFLMLGLLKKYAFSERLAALVTFIFMLVNVPILRTLSYGQINLHVENLILLCLICYPKQRLLSALALSLAVHLKVSPVVLVLAFLLVKDFRWIAWFSLFTVSIGLVVFAANGASPYLDFASNIMHVYEANAISFRENSIDSLVRALAVFLQIGGGLSRYLISGGKVLLSCAALLVTARNVKQKTFCAGPDEVANLYNAVPGLLVLMVMIAPLVWEHHPVLLALSYVVMLRNLSTAGDWLVYGLAYYLEFLVPTFDFFPWSYGRLLSPLIWLGLAWSLSKRPGPSSIFGLANEYLTDLNRIHGPTPAAPNRTI